jgi:hypothetical protein
MHDRANTVIVHLEIHSRAHQTIGRSSTEASVITLLYLAGKPTTKDLPIALL